MIRVARACVGSENSPIAAGNLELRMICVGALAIPVPPKVPLPALFKSVIVVAVRVKAGVAGVFT